MNKKLIALLVAAPMVCGIAIFTGVFFMKPSLLRHLPFVGISDMPGDETKEPEKTDGKTIVAEGPHPDQEMKSDEQPEALRQSSEEDVVLVASPDFVKPKSQTSPVGMAMREISALQARMAQGIKRSPQDLKASMLRAEKVFTANDTTLESDADIQSLAQYVLSGGNPSAASKALRNPSLSVQYKELIQGVLSYATADLVTARNKLLPVKTKQFNTLLNAQLTMVQVQLDDKVETDKKLERLSYVANIVPGTLIEEAAIRRMIPLLAQPKYSRRLLYWTARYFRRFSNSLYYGDFETDIIKTLVNILTAEPQVRPHLLIDVFANADERQAASLSSKMMLIAVQAGNTVLCGQIQNSLVDVPFIKAESFTDTNLLIEICKAAEGKIEVLEGLKKVDQSGLSEAVKINLNRAIAMAEVIQEDTPLKDDGRFGPHFPLSKSEDYASLFASVAQQIDISVSVIRKADDHETSLNE